MTTLMQAAQPSPFAVFRRRNFALLWTAQFISTMGTSLATLAASILVFRVTGSALSVGLMLIATALPGLFIGLVAGVFVDRLDRRKLMVAADLIRAVLVGLIPVLLPFGIGWLYAIVMLTSAVGQFFDPAQASVLPEVAPDEELAAANSMMTISSVGSMTVGYAAAGLLASDASVGWAFYLDALSFMCSALCVAGVRVPALPPVVDTSVAAVARNLRSGIAFVAGTPALRSLFILFMLIFAVFGFQNALMLPFATRALHASSLQYGILEGVFTIGFVLGSLLMAQLADRLHAGQWVSLSIIVMGVIGVAFAFAPSVLAAIGLHTVGGAANAPSYIGRSLLIQRSTPREMRGRVSSAFFVTRDTTFVLGMALVALADVLDVRLLALGGALALLGCGLLALVMPGLGQPTAEWRRMLSMLRAAPQAPRLGLGRAALVADVDRLIGRLPTLAGLSARERQELATHGRVYEAPAGTAVVRSGEASDAAYFLLEGRTVASRAEGEGERVLEIHNPGDFFGEIAALTGVPRTASVIAEQPTTLLQVPAATLRRLLNDPALSRVFHGKIAERMLRMNMLDTARLPGLDQDVLRELRTRSSPAA